VRYGPHTWPAWGNAEIAAFIESQRDTCKYIHDVRAVYTKELGMWDGDPVSLHPHPPVEAAKRYVDLIGAEAIMAEGRRAFDAGDYRWAAEILHKLVFAQPGNQAARDLQADTYEQMGYQAEGPQWRGIFLTAALELREGTQPAAFATASPDTILAMPIDILFTFTDHNSVRAESRPGAGLLDQFDPNFNVVTP
jgi:alkyl sulfatase BDS1-like metallo-beta-lactamase superfamily hydrolase